MPESRRNSIGHEIRLKGRLRDEFVCPITRQIMREPVTAADGHTYDHAAISRWLANHDTSPKTGEAMTNLLLPNFNLKRLIEDFIAEGGQGLIYNREEGNKNLDNTADNAEDAEEDEEFVLAYEKTIVLHCLGPADSPFCGRDIRVNSEGIAGGRKRMASGTKDTIIFTDATVSRRHFEINYSDRAQEYQITDLGSAGGTFLRIPHGEGMPIFEGMMILVGKHQFECVDRSKIVNDDVSVSTQPEILNELEDDARPVLARNITNNESPDSHGSRNENNNYDENLNNNNENDCNDRNVIPPPAPLRQRRGTKNEMQILGDDKNKWVEEFQDRLMLENSQNTTTNSTTGKNFDFPLALRCFAPDGSPIQDKVFDVNMTGTSIGRKEQNDIALCHKREGELLGLDSAVSGEHANIAYDGDKKQWIIYDGINNKASTNGTWYRLSAMQETSEPHTIKQKSEILIGTLRFVTKEDEELVEKDI